MRFLLLCLALSGLNACSAVNVSPSSTFAQVQTVNSTLSGKVQFPARFRTQTWSDIAQNTTVSLVYPPDHPQANQSLMTGLTNETGQFTLQDPEFVPEDNLVYLLEAARRLNDGPNDALALSTYVRWNGTVWESITGTSVAITPLTTTLTIMSDLNPALLPSLTLNSVTADTPTALGDISVETITELQNYVLAILAEGYDPTTYLRYDTPTASYSVTRPTNLPAQALRDLGHCPRCDLQASDLRNLTAPNADLRDANLRYADLSNADLTGADLSNADLRNSNLHNATLTQATLTSARFDGAQWLDGRICGENSLGTCL
jgi:hypothetical protein